MKKPWVCLVELYDPTRHASENEALAWAQSKVKLQNHLLLKWAVYHNDSDIGNGRVIRSVTKGLGPKVTERET